MTLTLAIALTLGASADQLSGTVYGVYPEGVMLNSNSGSYLVPSQHATFQLGSLRATWTSLQPGQAVQAFIPSNYYPEVQRIPDPYQWKVKHHPNHPHGGPPGQMKQKNGKSKNKSHKKWK